MSRQKLADEIITVLRASNCPLAVRDIIAQLQLHRRATKTEANSVLYGELSIAGLAQRDDSYRWSAVGISATIPRTSGSYPGDLMVPAEMLDVPAQELVKPGPLFSVEDFASIEAAVREEIAAANETTKTEWLDIDAIEHLPDSFGKFIYRLVLSTPAHFSPDQPVTFQTRHPKDSIPAIVVRSDDEGLVVECEKPLPTDAKLLSLSFDPVFILRALEDFIVQLVGDAGFIARLVVSKKLPQNRSGGQLKGIAPSELGEGG